MCFMQKRILKIFELNISRYEIIVKFFLCVSFRPALSRAQRLRTPWQILNDLSIKQDYKVHYIQMKDTEKEKEASEFFGFRKH